MNTRYAETDVRQVKDFDQVSFKGNLCSAQVFIVQGEQEGLTIEAPQEYLKRLHSEVRDGKLNVRLRGSWLQELEDALSTSLSRPKIVFHLQVRQLDSLHFQCIQSVSVSRLETEQLNVRLNGGGELRIDRLTAQKLEIHHSGTGLIQVSGQAELQTLILNGVGSYDASGLASQRASVRISGVGTANILVSDSLDVWLRGVGTLQYIGNPRVRSQISGPGQLVHIASTRNQAS